MRSKKPLVLLVLDGWGYSTSRPYNAIAKAHKPNWDKWWRTYPHMLLSASGEPVGLPDAQMGNSEVGHMHMGAGRVVHQDFTRINEAIVSGNFASNPIFTKTLEQMKHSNKTLHILGLLSTGGVHSHEQQLFAFLKLCHEHHFNRIALHLFLDGRDTPPRSALQSIHKLNDCLNTYPVARIASISGRYYAMDRDKRWDRTEAAFNLICQGQSPYQYQSVEDAITAFYASNIDDEFIPPTRIGTACPVEDGDSIFFFNFRADRARQLSEAFISKKFTGFIRQRSPVLNHFISMTPYADYLPTLAAFKPMILSHTLGEIIAINGLTQLRLAETEKYAHVTFFFNGGSEAVFKGEERILIPSPKVATYDLQAEMSAPQITQALIQALHDNRYDVIICNFANADMVGHSGNFDATVHAIECLDQCMGLIWDVLGPLQGQLLITADHGNAELMYDEKSCQAQTAHTDNPVPLLLISENWTFNRPYGSLIDIAPTMLSLLGINPPKEMTGHILVDKKDA